MNKLYWWLNEESRTMLERGYLMKNQTTKQKLELITNYAASFYKNNEGLAERFLELFERGWTSLSSPIWANFGQGRGLPISCVTGDTWINTVNGGKMAKDIVIGDMVLTHKNRFKPVIDVIPTKEKSGIYKLKVGTRMTDLFITGNHVILTNEGWVRVDELEKEKHLIATNGSLDYECENYTINMSEYTDYEYVIKEGKICKSIENKSEKSKKRNLSNDYVTYYSRVNHMVNVDNDLSWAFGIWFAEGSVTKNKKNEPNGISITINNKDEKWVAEKWVNIIKDKFNLNGTVKEKITIRNGKEVSWMVVTISSKIIGNLFNSFGDGCKHKVLPSWLMNLPKSRINSLIDGLLVGDGTNVRGHSNKITLSNPQLILQMYNMGLKTDKTMLLQMKETVSKLSTNEYNYSLMFTGLTNSLRKKTINSGIKFHDGLIYCPIKELILTDKIEDVYDFTVEDDHSFSCSGVVVHNCFNSHVPDNLEGIYGKVHEVAIMNQQGGGTSGYFGDLRAIGSDISSGGKSSGMMSFASLFDQTAKVVSQSGVRRGAFAGYLPIDHDEIENFIDIRHEASELQTMFTGVTVSNQWMNEMIGNGKKNGGDKKKRDIWAKVLKSRKEKGIPYIFFEDNVNDNVPQIYKDLKLKVKSSNLCTEIMLPSIEDESFVCCLLSMNLATYDEWKDTDAPKLAVMFLDAVMEDFIQKVEKIPSLVSAYNFAKRHRALGVGVLGWHSLLQQKMIPFESFEAQQLNVQIFKKLKTDLYKASEDLGDEIGYAPIFNEIETTDRKRRHTTLMAVAPTTSSSSILGQVSPSIEPFASNYFVAGLAKGSFTRKNPELLKLLETYGKNTDEVWKSIIKNQGSVKHLEFLTDREKDVFKTFTEINSHTIIQQAAARQPFIDQGQSTNLKIPATMPIAEVNRIHVEAWKLGLKTLYYQRSTSVAKETVLEMINGGCASCEA